MTDQQISLVKELQTDVLRCVKDQNGNHVIQKAIERVPQEHIQFIITAFGGQVVSLASHPYGCRVIQRMLEHCDEEAQTSILQELHSCTASLIADQYGNYVTQHVIEHGKDEERAMMVAVVASKLVEFSKHKFASNVVEKSIEFGAYEHKLEILRRLSETRPDGSLPIQVLIKDQYGNYVIQKLLTQLRDEDHEKLVEIIKPVLAVLKRSPHGKQIASVS